MSPIAQSIETTLPSSFASTSTGAPAHLERYIVFLVVPLVVIVALLACLLVARTCVCGRKIDAARETDVERGPDEPIAKIVNLSVKHEVVVVRANVRCSTYATLDATIACPTFTAASKTPTIVEVAARHSLAVEFDIADATQSSKESHVRDEPEHDHTSASELTHETRLRQPAAEAWWTTPKAVAVVEDKYIVNMANAVPRG